MLFLLLFVTISRVRGVAGAYKSRGDAMGLRGKYNACN